LDVEDGVTYKLKMDQSYLPFEERIPWEQLEGRLPAAPWAENQVLDWLIWGSWLEDVPDVRAKHHFHDPTRNAGLDNRAEHKKWAELFSDVTDGKFDLRGASSLERALGTEAAGWQDELRNYFNWPKAREFFVEALSKEDQGVREHYLALTFLALGHVLHLCEDAGVPAHVRNDFVYAHMSIRQNIKWQWSIQKNFGNPLERWAEKRVLKNIEDGKELLDGLLPGGWTPQAMAFSGVASYWDTDNLHVTTSGPYIDPATLTNWGLSERTCYQFLSDSTIFRDNTSSLYYFQHPDYDYTAPHPDSSIWYTREYRSGYGITHLAMDLYTQDYASEAGPINMGHCYTVFDEEIYEDYAHMTIPRTVDYVTGLANYFFRGKLDVELTAETPDVELTITNKSDNSSTQQTLKGGEFEIYWDDSEGKREKIETAITFDPVWQVGTSQLPYDSTLTVSFTPPSGTPSKYIVVYKGDISAPSAGPDPHDTDAVATGFYKIGYEIVVWGDDVDDTVDGKPLDTDFVAISGGSFHALALKADGSIVAWGNNGYGRCEQIPGGSTLLWIGEWGDTGRWQSNQKNFVAIAAGRYHSMALKSDGSVVAWGRDTDGQSTVPADAQSGVVAIAAGDYHSLALKSNGEIVGWGRNTYGQSNGRCCGYTDVAGGDEFSLAVASDGQVEAWGNDDEDQITDAPTGSGFEAVSGGYKHGLALRTNGAVDAWGYNDHGEGGDPEGTFTEVDAGGYFNAGLRTDGSVHSWGWDNHNQISENPPGTDFVAVSAGQRNGFALKTPSP